MENQLEFEEAKNLLHKDENCSENFWGTPCTNLRRLNHELKILKNLFQDTPTFLAKRRML